MTNFALQSREMDVLSLQLLMGFLCIGNKAVYLVQHKVNRNNKMQVSCARVHTVALSILYHKCLQLGHLAVPSRAAMLCF